MLTEFESLAQETGISLPPLLQRLLASGRTVYGPDWRTTWRERSLKCPPPLVSGFDFEWLTARDSRECVVDWLNPAFQGGRRFLPFAQNGAGDAYCLVPLDDMAVGVSLVAHDDDHSRVAHASFSDFVCVSFLDTFANLSHLLGERPEQEALDVLRADVSHVAKGMDPETGDYLRSFLDLAAVWRTPAPGCMAAPREQLSLIDQHRLAMEHARFPAPPLAPFEVVARWEVPLSVAQTADAVPSTDWRALALEPGAKMSAVRAYQQQHGVGLTEAKRAVDEHLRGG
jgi:hypothetical protein